MPKQRSNAWWVCVCGAKYETGLDWSRCYKSHPRQGKYVCIVRRGNAVKGFHRPVA